MIEMIEALERVQGAIDRVARQIGGVTEQFQLMERKITAWHELMILARRFKLQGWLLWLHIPKPMAQEIVARWPEWLLPRL